MNTILLIVAGWVLLSIVCGVFVGRFIRFGSGR